MCVCVCICVLVETGVFTASSHVVNAGMNVLSPSNTSDFERSLSISISWPESLDAPPPTTLYPCVCVCMCVCVCDSYSFCPVCKNGRMRN